MATTLKVPVIPNQKDGRTMAAKDKDDFGDIKSDVVPVVKAEPAKTDLVADADEVQHHVIIEAPVISTEDITTVVDDGSRKGQIPVYNVNDGPEGRNGGPFVDELPGAHPQLVTAAQLIIAHSTPSHVHIGPITAPIKGWIPDPEVVERERVAADKKAADKAAKEEKK